MRIRPERPADYGDIRRIVTEAFGAPDEAGLVEAIRGSPEHLPDLSLVADDDNRVVGHVMISHASLTDGDHERPVAILAPIAVDPARQGSGIGSALVNAATAKADDRGEPLVILLGSPGFYGRLGFEHSLLLGIEFPIPSSAPTEPGQLIRLTGYDASIRGKVTYSPAFDTVAD